MVQETLPCSEPFKEGFIIPPYVYHHSVQLGIETTLVQHPYPTNTCPEKCDLLRETFPDDNWSDNRVVKAIYALIGWDPYLFVFPELMPRGSSKKAASRKIKRSNRSARWKRIRKIRQKYFPLPQLTANVVHSLFSSSGITSSGYDLYPFVGADCIPSGMEHGTCTPFISPEGIKELNDSYYGGIKSIFIHDLPSLESKVVDISVGGQGNLAHRTSMHIAYGGIYAILKAAYGDLVHKLPFWKENKSPKETFL
ncbi:MAG TPA: hypothetical protein VJC39_05765 [Candidatus Nanoarchaeia archaeon]|nr:hypothetical protein [Candidatus Nanoarchaeia archaeon]